MSDFTWRPGDVELTKGAPETRGGSFEDPPGSASAPSGGERERAGVLGRLRALFFAKGWQTQARVPAGEPHGGEWTADGGAVPLSGVQGMTHEQRMANAGRRAMTPEEAARFRGAAPAKFHPTGWKPRRSTRPMILPSAPTFKAQHFPDIPGAVSAAVGARQSRDALWSLETAARRGDRAALAQTDVSSFHPEVGAYRDALLEHLQRHNALDTTTLARDLPPELANTRRLSKADPDRRLGQIAIVNRAPGEVEEGVDPPTAIGVAAITEALRELPASHKAAIGAITVTPRGYRVPESVSSDGSRHVTVGTYYSSGPRNSSSGDHHIEVRTKWTEESWHAVSVAQAKGITFHEAGHAVDYSLGAQATTVRYGRKRLYRTPTSHLPHSRMPEALAKDLAAMPAEFKRRATYWTTPTEAFAESYAYLTGHPSPTWQRAADFERHFRHSILETKRLLYVHGLEV